MASYFVWVTLWLVTVSESCMCLRHEMCTLKKEKGRRINLSQKLIVMIEISRLSLPALICFLTFKLFEKVFFSYFLVKWDKSSFCTLILPVLFIFWIFFEIVEIIIYFCIFRRNILPFQQFATLNPLYVVIFELYWHLIPPNICLKVVKV